eukprot:CAMPEP_0206492738 /NCGR_PEP_ID=MMETSP0324_2-20121206/46356_1 /ASSEMBLY_ACC=CAM_ASM_000836 /TAXON_ID=2866 /ORGANISM="Crypthecodinium cohnii, Strain Seligo" /LENGTH=127 /DNA_ID=CAMNT_0053975349 /DNA_START=128 /DNA_END=508 /DNA_ORIENTATION=+
MCPASLGTQHLCPGQPIIMVMSKIKEEKLNFLQTDLAHLYGKDRIAFPFLRQDDLCQLSNELPDFKTKNNEDPSSSTSLSLLAVITDSCWAAILGGDSNAATAAATSTSAVRSSSTDASSAPTIKPP